MRERAVRLVRDLLAEGSSLAAACRSVGTELSVNVNTLRRWTSSSVVAADASEPDGAAQSAEDLVAVVSEPASKPTTWRTVRLDALVGVVAAAGAGVSVVVGVAHLPWLWLLLLGVEVGAIGACATHALQAATPQLQVVWWRMSFLVLLVLPVGAFAYHQWFDPSTGSPRTFQMVVNGTEVDAISLYGEAGSQPQNLETGSAAQKGLIGGQTYDFECSVTGRDGAVWLRYQRFGRTWWAPRALLHPAYGTPEPEIPHC